MGAKKGGIYITFGEILMTDNELKELVASLAVMQKETGEQLRETGEQLRETTESLRETRKVVEEHGRQIDKQTKQIDKQTKQICEQGKQIGGLGNKFGSFTEGMAFPSMTKVLKEKFNMEIISTRVAAERRGKKLELDVFAYTNGNVNTAFIVEVKSHVKQDDLKQLLKILTTFPDVFPEHANKKLYVILAYVDMPDNVKKKILEQGIYLAQIHDEQFKLKVPKNFQAKSFGI